MAVSLREPSPLLTTGSVSPPRVMVRMKLALLRHSLADLNTATWMYLGGFAGLVLAVGTVWLGARDADLLATLLALWMLGWVVGPLFAGGGDEALRPEFFTSLGLSRWRLGWSLLLGSAVGIAPAVSLVAVLSLVTSAVSTGSLAAVVVALPAAAATLLMFITVSKLAVSLYGLLLRLRTGAVLAGIVSAFVLAFSAQGWALIVAFVSNDVDAVLARSARIAPSGWGLDAVEAASRGDWLLVLGALVGLLAISAAAFAAWCVLTARRTSSTIFRVRPKRLLVAHDRIGAATAHQLRALSRDLLNANRFVFAVGYGLFFCLMPLAVGWAGMLPWAGPIFVVMAAMMWSNQYGGSGTALWLTLATPGAEAVDIRARQRVFALMVVPLSVVLTLGLTWAADSPRQWPYVASVLPALVGAAIGMTTFLSLYTPVPTTDPHKRSGNPLSTGADAEESGTMYLALVAVAVFALPPLVVTWLAGWWGVAAGVLTGWLTWRVLTRLAIRRLETRGVELLALLRHGRTAGHGTASSGSQAIQNLPKRKQRLLMFCAGFGAIPLFPQGLVPAYFLSTGKVVKSWFLAMWVPAPWAWPVAIGMILLGLGMYGYAGWTYRQAVRTPVAEASEPPVSARS
ncbi:MAG: hypothetical protein ABWX96_06140 [Propionibacteriaceae bacterium]